MTMTRAPLNKTMLSCKKMLTAISVLFLLAALYISIQQNNVVQQLFSSNNQDQVQKYETALRYLQDVQAKHNQTLRRVKDQESQIETLKRELENAKKEIVSKHIQPDTHEETHTSAENSNPNPFSHAHRTSQDEGGGGQSEMCKAISPDGSNIPHVLDVWNADLTRIIDASKLYPKGPFFFRNYVMQLLHMVSPDRLARSTLSLPHEWQPVQRAMSVLWERYNFITTKVTGIKSKGKRAAVLNSPDSPPKLKIVIFGGSVLVGRNCPRIRKVHGIPITLPMRECSWAFRLQAFLNNILGGLTVEVHKVSVGGTNSETGGILIDFDLIPEEAKNPDIIINAYSTNDMHVSTVKEALENGQTLSEKVLEITEKFVRTVMSQAPECAPLMIHFQDYLGNEQRDILQTVAMQEAVSTLSSYYGFSSISYANVIRDIVYKDTREEWLSPYGWYEEGVKDGKMEREIHPEMGMHIIASWVTSYNFLNLALTYCSIEGYLKQEEAATSKETGSGPIPYHSIYGLPEIDTGGITNFENKPDISHAHNRLPPPLYTRTLLLDDISSLWSGGQLRTCDLGKSKSCPFGWMGGASGEDKNFRTVEKLFSNFTLRNDGWTMVDTDTAKLGWAPMKGKTWELDFPFSATSISILYMKSYGEKWESSRVRCEIENLDTNSIVETELLEGTHNKTTSETYSSRFNLKRKSSSVKGFRIRLTLVGGTYFKMMGLALCVGG